MSILEKFKLDGKTGLVTGCKHGIGRAMTLALAEAGADIIGVSVTLEESGSEIEQEVKSLGRKFRGYTCDFADRKALYDFVSRVKSDNPVIDILVNNAGTIMRKPAVEHPDEYWDKVMETNLNSHFVITREIGKEMVARGSGKVIFVASMLTFQGGILVPSYAASKGGIGQLTKALANEWATHGVNVNAIAPGYIDTDMLVFDEVHPLDTVLETIPQHRLGQPEDIARAVKFLCSADSNYITGQVMHVNGGLIMY